MSQELLEKLKQGEQEAFNKIVETHKQMVFRTAIGFLHDKDAAEDIVQDVFVKLWEIRNEFTLTSKLSTWLYRVTVNMSINYLRRKKFSTAFSLLKNNDENNLEDTLPDSELPDDKIKQSHIKKALKTAINSLPKKQKTAFVLHKYQNLSYKEIAEVMETSVSSVESLIHRAKKKLQQKLFDVYKNLNH